MLLKDPENVPIDAERTRDKTDHPRGKTHRHTLWNTMDYRSPTVFLGPLQEEAPAICPSQTAEASPWAFPPRAERAGRSSSACAT